MFHALSVLMRARLQITRNNFLRSKLSNKIGLIIITVFLGFGAYGLYWLIYSMARSLSNPQFLERLNNTPGIPPQFQLSNLQPYIDALPSQILFLALLVVLLTSIGTVLSSLYLSGDLDMLLVAPIPMRAVFLFKFFSGLWVPYLLLFAFLGPALLGYGQGLGYGLAFNISLVVVLLLVPLLPAGLAALIVMMVVRIMPARRAREIVGVIGAIFGASWYIFNIFANEVAPEMRSIQSLEALRGLDIPVFPSAWAGRALVAAGKGEWLTLLAYGGLFTILSLAVFTGCLLLAEKLYYAGWTNLATQGGRVRSSRKTTDTPSEPLLTRLMQPFLSVQTRAILLKDLRIFPRDLRNLQQLIFPLVMAVIWTIQLLRRDGPTLFDEPTGALLSQTGSLGISFFVCLTISNTLAGPSISREGRNFWLLHIAPIKRIQILIAKLVLAYLPFPTIGTLFTLGISLIAQASPIDIVRALLLIWLAGLGVCSISLGIGAVFPKFDWENPNQQSSTRASCLSPIFYLLYLAVVMVSVFGPLFFAPMLSSFWLRILVLIGWLVAFGITALTVWGSLRLGAARLEQLELH
jgi:ABC-2 type transport system permease protein